MELRPRATGVTCLPPDTINTWFFCELGFKWRYTNADRLIGRSIDLMMFLDNNLMLHNCKVLETFKSFT